MRTYYDSNDQFIILAGYHPVLYRADSCKFHIGGKKKSGFCIAFRVFLYVGDF